ncbi:MAG: right-handed parallel beta-helix repeat-containing protein [Terracidiphilus sp.]
MKPFFKIALLCSLGAFVPASAQTVHYLDCASGSDSQDGLSPQSAWKTTAAVDRFTFAPGDSLLLKRGTECTGILWPKGSGAEGKPIRIAAYGAGPLPRIIGTGNEAGLKFFNQQYWEIRDLDVTGGNPYGIVIGGNLPHLAHFHIADVVVHDVTGEPKTKQSGLVVVVQDDKAATIFDDILIDGVTAYNTTQWAGILINAASDATPPDGPRGSDIVVRNSVIHDVAGDAILVQEAKNVLIERNAAWEMGLQYTESIGTPDGIWEWMCHQCTVQYNEGFFSDSPGVDGGVFDIDYGNVDNTVQYNFGHDSQGYCVSIFGADKENGTSSNSVIRDNLCLDNGRSPRLAQRQGAIFLATWDGGRLVGVQVYNNTVVWDAPMDTAAVVNQADIDPSAPHVFSNNIVVSRVPALVRTIKGLDFKDNRYWVTDGQTPLWTIDAKDYSGLQALQAATSQERGSEILNPHFGPYFEPAAAPSHCSPSSAQVLDLYGRGATSANCAAGAVVASPLPRQPERPLPALQLESAGKPFSPKGWTLLVLLAPEGHDGAGASRSQIVVLQSMIRQFAPLGLHCAVAPSAALAASDAVNWSRDWNFGAIELLGSPRPPAVSQALGLDAPIATILISPAGKIVHEWDGLTASPEIELTLRALLGTPVGMQKLPGSAELDAKP